MQTYMNLTNFLATFVAIAVIDIFGRKQLLMYGGVGMTIAMLGMGFIPDPTENPDATTSTNGAIFVILAIFYIASFAASWGPTVWTYEAEMYPLVHRSRCMAMATLTNWVGNYIIAQFSPVLLGMYGMSTFHIFAVFCVICVL